MAVESDADSKLANTLHLARANIELANDKILAHGYTGEERKLVHRETNERIRQSLITNSLGECIHITGEMRALTDPFHRFVCEEISQKEKDVFRVVYSLPQRFLGNATKILEWNLTNWSANSQGRTWYENLRTIYAIANKAVNLFALDLMEEVQYSVFGHKYVLLQEKHADKATSKHTWLLESEALNSLLCVQADELIRRAASVDEGIYRRFTQSLTGTAAKRILSLLKSGGNNASRSALCADELVKDFSDSPEEVVEALKVMGFVAEDSMDSLRITSAGKEFSE